MPNSFQELEGCCVSSTFTRATFQVAVFHTVTCFLAAFTPTIKQEADTLTTHFGRSWLWDRHVSIKGMTRSQTQWQRTWGSAVAYYSGLIHRIA